MRPTIALCLSLALLTGCSSSGPKSDWERANEGKLAGEEAKAQAEDIIPTPPNRRGELIEFSAGPTTTFRFFIDAQSLSVDSQGIVRYVLVALSPEGVENVTFEGLKCETDEVRIYALGRDGAWVGRPGDWRKIDARTATRWHYELSHNFFCPQRDPIASANEGIRALREGGHPYIKGQVADPRLGGR